MRKTTKRLLAIAAIITTVSAYATVNAEYDPNRVMETPITATKSVADNTTITINGKKAINQKIMSGETVMIPLREVAETLGYNVIWNEKDLSIELLRGEFSSTIKIGDNINATNTNARTTESAVTLVNDCTTYVPLSFVGGVIEGRADILADGSIDINEFEEAIITSISENADKKYIMVNDTVLGEVMIHISEDTVITRNGNAASFEDFTADMQINVVYGPAMTMSLPPQTTAIKIEIVDVAQENIAKEVTVKEVLDNSLVVDDTLFDEVIVHISEETKITKNGEVAKFEDISKDMKIKVVYSPAMTMSLPPQTTAISIEISDSDSEITADVIEFSGVIKEIDERGLVIVDLDNSDDEVALIVSDETNIAHIKNKRRYMADDLTAGMKISGKHSAIMTRSIPPQTAAFEIIIAE